MRELDSAYAESKLNFLLRKHAYSNILKILPPKNENSQIKKSDIFHASAQNIDCGYSLEPPRCGGSNEYPQSMFLSRKKKYNVYPCKPQFYYIKLGFKGVKIIWYVYVMAFLLKRYLLNNVPSEFFVCRVDAFSERFWCAGE